jgi:hypothetical protein
MSEPTPLHFMVKAEEGRDYATGKTLGMPLKPIAQISISIGENDVCK